MFKKHHINIHTNSLPLSPIVFAHRSSQQRYTKRKKRHRFKNDDGDKTWMMKETKEKKNYTQNTDRVHGIRCVRYGITMIVSLEAHELSSCVWSHRMMLPHHLLSDDDNASNSIEYVYTLFSSFFSSCFIDSTSSNHIQINTQNIFKCNFNQNVFRCYELGISLLPFFLLNIKVITINNFVVEKSFSFREEENTIGE